jgi:hypothetical protein
MLTNKTMGIHSILLLLVAAAIISCNGCAAKKDTNMHEAITDTVAVNLPASSFNIPVTYQLSSLQQFLNGKISGQFMDMQLDPFGKDKELLQLTFTKSGSIQLDAKKKRLHCTVPITINGNLLKSRLGGLITNAVKPVTATLQLQLSTPVALDAGWRLVTQFKLDDYTWLQEPVVKVGPLKKNLKKILNNWLDKNHSKLTSQLNQELNKSVSLQPTLAKIWSDLQRPMVIHKNTPVTWLQFNCRQISGNIQLQPNAVVCYTSIDAKTVIMTDSSKQLKSLPLPAFTASRNVKKESEVHLYAFISFDEINEAVNKRLGGTVINAKGYQIQVKDIKVYASKAGLSIRINTTKDVECTVVVSGRLGFNTTTQQLQINDFDFDVATSNVVVNAGNMWLHDVVRDSIAGKLWLDLNRQIMSVPALVEKAIAKGKSGQAIDLYMDSLVIKACAIEMGARKIHFNIHAGVGAGIALKKINTGKKLRIKPKQK